MPLRFINPNFHVILVHYPLGVFVLGVFLELFSLLWRKGSIRIAGVWMIMLGAFLSLPAVTSGIYALYDVAHHQGIGGDRFKLLRFHVIFQSGASLLAVLCSVVGLGASDRWREKLRLPLLLGVSIACGGMIFGSWNGGETVYQHGTAVQSVDNEGEIQNPEKPAFKTQYAKITKYYIGGEMQVHLIVAGFALSAVVGALGLSIRRLTTHIAEEAQLESEAQIARLARGSAPTGPPRRVTDDLTVIRSFNPEAEVEADLAHVPAGRWWLVAAAITLATAALGYWTMSKSHALQGSGFKDFLNTFEWPKSWALADIKSWEVTRHTAHLILGSAMVVFALILGLVARFAPRRPLLLTFFATLMVLVVAGQVWMGVLLTFDEDEGPLTHFNKPEKSDEAVSPSPAAAPDAAPSIAPTTVPTTAPTAATSPTTAPA